MFKGQKFIEISDSELQWICLLNMVENSQQDIVDKLDSMRLMFQKFNKGLKDGIS